VREILWDRERRILLRRFRNGSAAIDGYAEDYAFLIFGLLELLQTTGDATWLAWVLQLQARQDELFWDPIDRGWFSTTGNDPSVLVRLKEEYDGAEPSASAVGAWNLLTLGQLTGDAAYTGRAHEVFAAFGSRLSTQGRGLPMMAAALARALVPPEHIVVVGSPAAADTRELWTAAQRDFRPFSTLVPVAPGEPQQRIAQHMPWVAAMGQSDGRAAAYVCRDFVCDAPVSHATDLPLPRHVRDASQTQASHVD
jgi:uncharacterized protein YyaL (SSP411 family)